MANKIWTKSEDSLLTKMTSDGLSSVEISKRLNRGLSSIRNRVHGLNLSIKRESEPTISQIEKLIILRENNTPIPEISKIIGKCAATIYKLLSILEKSGRVNRTRTTKINEKKKILIREYIRNGIKIPEIAKLLDICVDSVSKICKKENNYTQKSRQVKEQLELKREGLKKCRKCEEVKKYTKDFFYAKSRGYCIKCQTKTGELGSLIDILRLRLASSKTRSKKKNFDFDIDLDFLLKLYEKQNGKCFYSGRVMSMEYGNNNVISLDRYNSNKGYTKDNVVMSCKIINTMKLDIESNEFKKICGEIFNHSLFVESERDN